VDSHHFQPHFIRWVSTQKADSAANIKPQLAQKTPRDARSEKHQSPTLAAMGYARKSLISLRDTPYYHLIGRCVRRSWLCGVDSYTKKDYSHRKQWVVDRLMLLSKAFAVDVCAYAIMSNHCHLIVHVDQRRARSWTTEDVIERWRMLFDIPDLVERSRSGNETDSERNEAQRVVQIWRTRLSDVSWYMRCLREYLARRANAEDECSGQFWDGRFKSQALLDETGLLTAMAYVDLNPVRAGIASTPEESDFTSIQARIAAASNSRPTSRLELLPFKTSGISPQLPFSFKNYLSLVDWTGRRIQKKGARIDARQPSILARLKIEPGAWDAMMQTRGNRFGRALGPLDYLRVHARTLGQAWVRGHGVAAALFRAS
jgi:REP element-mobilizing transposase RayT